MNVLKPKEQWEEDSKTRFITELKAQGRGEWVVSDSDVVVDPTTNINFDYQLKSGPDLIALELFRLVETTEEIKRGKAWSQISNLIADKLRKKGVKGFTIQTPNAFNVPTNKIEKFADKMADRLHQAIQNNSHAESIEESGFEAQRIKDFEDVSMFTVGPGGAVNPTGMAHSIIDRKLPKKNKQLAVAEHERIVVIVNGLPLVGTDNVIEACSLIDFSQFQNIDKVFLEVPHSEPPRFAPVYDRRVYDAFREGGAAPKQVDPLFVSWLTNHLSRKHPQAFPLIREITERERTLLWLPPFSREQLVPLGEDFVQEGRADELHWIVEHLKDDPDPSIEPREDDPDGRSNEHLRVLRGEESRIITSVRGRLCWLLMRMVVHPRTEDYDQIFKIVAALATGKNLYVRQQATVPLIELARRRLTKMSDGPRFMSDELAAQVLALVLHMIEENRDFPVILEWIAHVMGWIRDLNDEQAFHVLNRFLVIQASEAANDISWMAIYFSVFRAAHFTDLAPFNPSSIQGLLSNQMAKGAGRFRALAMSHFKALLSRGEIQFQIALPYIEAGLNGMTDRVLNHHFYGIAASEAANHSGEICSLIEKCVVKELEGLSQGGREVWYPKEFKTALDALRNAGPEYSARVTKLVDQMEPYEDRIVNLYDF
jgi:hypothetical protein